MKKSACILLAILTIFVFFNILFLKTNRGVYFPVSNSYFCNLRKDCLHEIGHASDDSLGWISQSKKYTLELMTYQVVNWKIPIEQRHPMAESSAFFPGFIAPIEKENNPFFLSFWHGGWGGNRELYAEMLNWADGSSDAIPESLRAFYNWELINKEIKKIDPYSNGQAGSPFLPMRQHP